MREEPIELASDALRCLQNAMSGMEAPPAARAAALAAYRAEQGRRRKRTLRWALAAVAACAVFAIVAVRSSGRILTTPPPVVNLHAPAPPRVDVANAVDPKLPHPAVAKRKRRASRALAARRESQSPEPAQELATDFLPLPYAPPLDPGEGGQVIRVRLPRAALASVGLPVADNAWRDRVPADVVVGGDGIARAVRFVGFAK